MSSLSYIQGRAYEFACLMALFDRIKNQRSVKITEDGCYEVCKKEWEQLDSQKKSLYILSANAAVDQILILEPRIEENDDDIIELLLQPDSAGENGDVRDILIIRSSIQWEIGLSLKHNNFAVKHSRLAANLDFGNSWFGVKCSQQYWDNIRPIFQFLQEGKDNGLKFNQIENKEDTVYVPILKAFKEELQSILNKNSNNPAKLVEYLLGKFDFYKVISIDSRKLTTVQAVNIHKTLNLPSKKSISPFEIPQVKLPKRLIHLDFAPESKTTLELYLDGGWQFTFRIHNASSKMEPSLKFDIQIVGMPAAVITFNCRWS